MLTRRYQDVLEVLMQMLPNFKIMTVRKIEHNARRLARMMSSFFAVRKNDHSGSHYLHEEGERVGI